MLSEKIVIISFFTFLSFAYMFQIVYIIYRNLMSKFLELQMLDIQGLLY